jgi:hypothetical protein
MTAKTHDKSRRRFLHHAVAGAVAAPIVGLRGSGRANAAEQPKLDPSDPQAKALKYVHDASEASDNPAFKEGANCGNCIQWTGGDADWGGCNIFPGKQVAREGWCTVWAEQGG